MLGLVGAFTVATRQHSMCINAATAWCHLLGTWSWSQSWEKPTAVSENASGARLPQPASALHPFLVTRPGLARAAEAWTSTATAHGGSPLGLGKAQGQHLQLCLHQAPRTLASLHHPLSTSVDSFVWRFWELTACGIGAQAPRATSRANLTILSQVSNLGILSCPARLLAVRKLRTRGWAKAGRMPVPSLCLSPPPGWTFRGNPKARVTCGKRA